MRLFMVFVGLLVTALPPVARQASAAAAVHCSAPPELIEDEPSLPRLARHFKQHSPVTIVVIGGASTAGIAPDNAYPYFLDIALRRRHPKTQITVINRGVRGQTAAQMAARFAKDVYADHADLVIWETGTVDAVRGKDVNAFAETLDAGIAALRAHKVELMLMDMQYNPSTDSVINFEPYLDALHHTATLQDVYMFRRFDIMKYWDESGAFDLTSVPKAKRLIVAREFYECLGERLADAIDYAAR